MLNIAFYKGTSVYSFGRAHLLEKNFLASCGLRTIIIRNSYILFFKKSSNFCLRLDAQHFEIHTRLSLLLICWYNLIFFSQFLWKYLWRCCLFRKFMVANFSNFECGLYYLKLDKTFNVYRAVRVQHFHSLSITHRWRSHQQIS